MTDLESRVRAWLEIDPDAHHRDELERLLATGATDKLRSIFGGRLRFGTSGIRGQVGPGPVHMNRVVVRQTAAGLASWLGADARVVVGFDGRLTSREFAEDIAMVLAANGCVVELFSTVCPTPVLACAVRWRDAAAGVMVTASHNPPADNGVKVYLSNGAQPVPPVDAEIEAAIEAAPAVPRDLPRVDGIAVLGDEAVDHYVELVAAAVPLPEGGRPVVAYTPMHGVGGAVFAELLQRCGLAPPVVVPAQSEPDGRFPTVAFPNPEEPGALDLLVELAIGIGADVALAHDPDADRLAAAFPNDGAMRVLSGDELGLLLCDHMIETTEGADRLVVSTAVSSSAVRALAECRGVTHITTLTGFKWIVRPGLEHPELRFVFGYEEALGYSVVEAVRDKDGMSAGLAVLAMMGRLGSRGRSPLDRLDELAREIGVHATDQVTVRFDGENSTMRMAAAMAAVRETRPTEVAGAAVTGVVDYREREPAADLLVLDLEGSASVKLRPSGTEPKLKIYLEVVEAVGPAGLVAARSAAADRLARLHAAAESLLAP